MSFKGEVMKTTHTLKIIPEYFIPLERGIKNFEIRYNDRNYQVGDVIEFREYFPDVKEYSGEWIMAKIIYILDNQQFLREGYVALGLETL